MKTFAQKIKAERKKRGLTQTEMGNLLGVSQRMVLAYETAGRRPHRAKMQEFAEKLELPLAYLAEDQYDSILSVFNGITSAQTEPVPVQEAPASAAAGKKGNGIFTGTQYSIVCWRRTAPGVQGCLFSVAV